MAAPILQQLGSAEKGKPSVMNGSDGPSEATLDTPLAAPPEAPADSQPPAQRPAWEVGDRVRLVSAPRYLKTADPMPMLRPPDLVDANEVGLVVEIRALDQLAVRFRRGTFLLPAGELSGPE